MFTAFTQPDHATYGDYLGGVWPSTKEQLQRVLKTVVNYYHDTTNVVNSEHYLVRILQNFTLPKSLATDRYYENMMAVVGDFSMSQQLTSTRYVGRLKKGVLYGVGVTEAWIADLSEFDYNQGLKDWKNLSPIRILQHPRSDMSLAPLDGRTFTTETGMAVIVLHLPMLLMMYRAFVQDEVRKMKEITHVIYTPQPVMQFVYRYVITNALRSHWDVALFNRFTRILKTESVGEIKRRLPIGVPDHTSRLDYALFDIKKKVIPYTKNIRQWLSFIPAITLENQALQFTLPDMLPIRTVNWVMNYVLAKPLDAYMTHTVDKGRRMNAPYLTQADKLLRRMSSDKTYLQILPQEEQQHLVDTVKRFTLMQL